MFSVLNRRGALFALLFAFSLVAAACAEDSSTTTTAPPADSTTTTDAPTTTTTPPDQPTTTTVPPTTLPPPPEFKVCEVTDTGGIDDRSFNETGFKGATDAVAQIDGVTEAKFLESQSPDDFRPNIDSFIDEECDLIVTVGYLLSNDTGAAALDNPGATFMIIDFPVGPFAPWCEVDDAGACTGDVVINVRGATFNIDEATFLAGYAAAAMSETGIVGTFGGINIPPVTQFMDGFFWGIQQYNEDSGASVRLLGWDPADPEIGLFSGDFESTSDGFNLGQTLSDEGADIIMPVAGPVGLGTAAFCQDNDACQIVGVDSDWVESSDTPDIILTSALKRLDTAVFQTVNNLVTLGSLGNPFVGALTNDGVGLTPVVGASQELIDRLAELRSTIIAGTQSISGPDDA